MKRRVFSSSPSVEVIQCFLQDLFGSQVICIDDYMGMFMSMGEPAELFLIIFHLPIEFATRSADGEGCVKKYQDVGIGNDLPHGGDVGVFLCDVTARVAISFETRDECGFS